MTFYLYVLVNRVPLETTWMRSPEERAFSGQTAEALKLAQELIELYNIEEYTICEVERMTYEQILTMVKNRAGAILNLCIGIDLDGLAGPGLTLFLENNGIPYFGPSSLFQTHCYDKWRMMNSLEMNRIKVPNHWFLHHSSDINIDKEIYPLRLRPADSLAPVGLRGTDLVVFDFERYKQAVINLRANFPLILVEEHDTNVKDFWFLVSGVFRKEGEIILNIGKDDIARNLALAAYCALGGDGHAMIQVSYREDSGEYYVKDAIANNALILARRMMDKKTLLDYVVRGLKETVK